MSSILVINAAGRETRVALVESGDIAEFYLERKKDKGIVGNIYKGRVVRVLPGMQAAFLDIGLDKAAFLYVSDVVYDPDFARAAFELTEGEHEDDVPEVPEGGELSPNGTGDGEHGASAGETPATDEGGPLPLGPAELVQDASAESHGESQQKAAAEGSGEAPALPAADVPSIGGAVETPAAAPAGLDAAAAPADAPGPSLLQVSAAVAEPAAVGEHRAPREERGRSHPERGGGRASGGTHAGGGEGPDAEVGAHRGPT